MRIISKFKDYYDIGMMYGVDKSHTYERKLVEIKSPSIRYPAASKHAYRNGPSTPIIGFCGKTYPVVNLMGCNPVTEFKKFGKLLKEFTFVGNEVTGEILRYRTDPNNNHQIISKFNLNEIDEIAVETYFKKQLKELNATQKKQSIFFSRNFEAAQHQNWFDYVYAKYKCPIFYLNSEFIYLNPPLVNFCFYRVLDPIKTFQELEMFAFRADDKMPKNREHDKIIAESKGFDKYSFRRQPY